MENIYIFASSEKDQKISINKKDYSFTKIFVLKLKMEVYTISTKSF
jgi:hypothetical protein